MLVIELPKASITYALKDFSFFSFGIVIPSLLLQYCVIPSFDTDVVK